MKEQVDILVVAFNKHWVIQEQLRLLEKYFLNDFNYIIIENSNVWETHIDNIAATNQCPYERVHFDPTNSSLSHGQALTYGYEKYIKNSDSRYFMTLDHDIFLTKAFDCIWNLDQGIYGLPQNRGSNHYLWPGLSAFDKEFVLKTKGDLNLDFKPYGNMDTGGGNCTGFYDKLNFKEMDWPTEEWVNIKEEKIKHIQLDGYAKINPYWIHMVNASGWFGGVPEKEKYMQELVKSL